MASSSKRSRAASTKKSSTGNARRISLRRADVLPRTGTASAGRRKPGLEPPIDSSTEALAKPVARSKKKAQRPEQSETVATRTKTRRPGGPTSARPKKPTAKAITRVAPGPVPMSVDLRPEAGTLGMEPTALEAPAVEAPAALETEIVVEASAILEEATIATTLPPPPHSGQRPLVGAIWRLLSTLRRWTVARR